MAETIVLGGLRLEVHPLKLGQLRHVVDALGGMADKSGGGLIEAAARVIAAGLVPAHPELTVEKILDLEADIEQLNDAVTAVLRIAGLCQRENGAGAQMMGEAQPVATQVSEPETDLASSSPQSMVRSLPAAATPIR